MRIWSIDPHYLDAKGLVALWREALLAQHVLLGKTKDYRHHPQLIRFRETANPVGAIATYLRAVATEADSRGYNFDTSKIENRRFLRQITVTKGQIDYEFNHLLNKLEVRDPERYERYAHLRTIRIHPLFERVNGDLESWEVV